MRNKHAGICYRCGKVCEAGAGYFERHNGGFRVQHVDCATKYKMIDTLKTKVRSATQ